jgi:hypothetical protein
MDALTRVCILFFAAIGGLAADQLQLVWFDPLAPGVWPDGRTGPVGLSKKSAKTADR